MDTKLETKAGRRVAAPAVHTRRAGATIADIATRVDNQGRLVQKAVRAVARSEAMRRLNELKQRGVHQLRQAAEHGARLSRRGRGDVLVQHQISRINTAIDGYAQREAAQLRAENVRMRRQLARPGAPNLRAGQHRANPLALLQRATKHYLMTGETSFMGHSLHALQNQVPAHIRAGWTGSGAAGGFLVMPEHDMGPIEKQLAEVVPMRAHADVRVINSESLNKPVRTSLGGAKWGDELSSGGVTDTPKFALLNYPALDLYAEPTLSRNMLEDSAYPIEQEIADGSIEDFALAEGIAFITGNGAGRPYGILGYGADKYVDNASWEFGKIGFKATGAAGAFPTPTAVVGSGDPVVKLQYEMLAQFRPNAKWMMNRSTIGVCRTLKDVEGRYIWSDASIQHGTPQTLDGREVIEAEQMPNIAADSFAIALADWKRAYIIVDRVGLMVLRDELTRFPMVAFKTRKRVGGGINQFNAIKLLKFAA